MDQNADKTTVDYPGIDQPEKESTLESLIHDIRSPLSGIQSISAILLKKKRMSRRELEMISVINSTSVHILKMLDGQRENPGSEDEKLKKKTTNIRRLVEETILILEFKASQKSQKITISNRKKVIAHLDAPKIQRVITNLVDNAIKFSSTGSSIHVSVTQKKNNVLVAVDDNGIGIPTELTSNIFDITTTPKRQGTNNEATHGLGLSISKQIVELHGGKIWFENKVNGGTVFFVELPLLHL